MTRTFRRCALTMALGVALVSLASTSVRAAAFPYSIAVGYAKVHYNVRSGELSGPPGTTPPGVSGSIHDLSTLGFEITVQLGDGWAATLAGGAPPIVNLRSTGTGIASALGRVGQARAWFPAALLSHTFNRTDSVRPYYITTKMPTGSATRSITLHADLGGYSMLIGYRS